MQIKEVAKKYGLSNDTLRYYEKEGLIGPIAKNSSGIRDYSEDDLKRIEFVKCMRSAQMPVATLKEYLDLLEIGDETLDRRITLLKNEQTKIMEKIKTMQAAYDKLAYKIELFSGQKQSK